MRRMGWLYVIFGGIHVLLGLGLFGFITWMMLGESEDDAEESGGGGGGWRWIKGQCRHLSCDHAPGAISGHAEDSDRLP